MFQFPWFASDDYGFIVGCRGINPRRVSPFGDLRIKVCLTTPRSLSQLATSFIAFLHQGILRVLLVT